MSRFVQNSITFDRDATLYGGYAKPEKSGRFTLILKIAVALLSIIGVATGVGAYFYWQSLKKTPQYSLALLIDAARDDNQAAVNELIDTNAAVDDFLPQITSKAIELYGRGLPPRTLERVELIAAPVMPAVKDRAREELPRLIREKTAKFENVPFAALALGADKYLDIDIQDDKALISSKLKEHAFEVKMRKSGNKWQIVGVRDEQLATMIAHKIGQEIIAIASKGDIDSSPGRLGVKDIGNLLKQAQEIFR